MCSSIETIGRRYHHKRMNCSILRRFSKMKPNVRGYERTFAVRRLLLKSMMSSTRSMPTMHWSMLVWNKRATHWNSLLCSAKINRVFSSYMDSDRVLLGQSKHRTSVGEFLFFKLSNVVGSNWRIHWDSEADIRWSSLIYRGSVNRVDAISIKPLGNGMVQKLSSLFSAVFIFNSQSASSHNAVSCTEPCSSRKETVSAGFRWSSHYCQNPQSISSMVPRS